MKTRGFNQYYCGVIRSAAIVAGVALLATQVAYPASTDVIPKWIVLADAPLPASGTHGATQLAQDEGSAAGVVATGTAPGEPTAADDAAVVFQPHDCTTGNVGGCVQRGGGSGNGAASAGNNGASGNGASGGTGAGGGAGKGNGGGSGGGSSGGGSSGGGSSGGGNSGGGSSSGGSSGGGSSGGGGSGGGSS
ncbi:MAG: hypothetical protein QOC89_6003, partial [Paraburkholderia sp.]|uniref:hypothetical protein n=1 Tax=Paraburkholderia sp. TaxID=1926495 RepID=UPI002AFED7F2